LLRILTVALLLLAPAPSLLAQNQLWIVDDNPGPGVDFGAIQPAIDAASEGDSILIRDGEYAGFVIVGKSLELLSDDFAAVGPSSVSGLGPNQWVSLYRMNFRQIGQILVNPTLKLEACAGRVWMQHCVVSAGSTSSGANTLGMRIQDCQVVDLLDSTVSGAFGKQGTSSSPSTGNGSVGLEVSFSRLFAFNTTFVGGSGGSGLPDSLASAYDGGNGALAMRADGGELYLERCDLYGGSGGSGSGGFDCGEGGDAAYALKLNSVPSWIRGCQIEAGYGGSPGFAFPPYCNDYGFTPPTAIDGPVPESLGGPVRRLEFMGPAKEGQNVPLLFRGAPGDFALLLFAPAPAGEFLPAYQGARLVSYPGLSIVPVGSLDGGGMLQSNLTMPQLPPGLSINSAFLQGAFFNQGQFWLGSGIHLHLLDSSL
jgi:hypothetical protein